VDTATLTVSSADSNNAGHYRAVVTAGCGSATSNTAALTIGTLSITGDFDDDLDVDQVDFGHMQRCLDPAGGPALDPNCASANLDNDEDGDVNQADLMLFLNCMTRPGVTGNANCAG
jgi:hypothetical protein